MELILGLFRGAIRRIINLLYQLKVNSKGNNKLILDISSVEIVNCTFNIKGYNNEIIIKDGTCLKNCEVYIRGNNCRIYIGKNSILKRLVLWLEDSHSCIKIGNCFSVESGHFASTEGGKIIIGDNCLFSTNIEIRNGDSHSIIDCENNYRLNHASDVEISNDVWVGANVVILKGSFIPNDSIVANSSVVIGKMSPCNSIIGGYPAKTIKTGVRWIHKRI